MNKDAIVSEIYDAVSNHGLAQTLYALFGNSVSIKMAYSKKCCETIIEALSFSVRSYNALKRNGMNTVGSVIDALGDNKLLEIRNLGKKSFIEIQVKILEYGYSNLSEMEKKAFILDTVQRNGAIKE